MINKQQYEAQLQQIFRLLLENKSQEEIARELNNINTIDYSKMNVRCHFGFEEKFAENYIPSPPYNNWLIQYVATNDHSFSSHHQEFLNALSTIDLQS